MPTFTSKREMHRNIDELEKEMFRDTADNLLNILSNPEKINRSMTSRSLFKKSDDNFVHFNSDGSLKAPIGHSEEKRVKLEARIMGVGGAEINDITKLALTSALFEASTQTNEKYLEKIMNLQAELAMMRRNASTSSEINEIEALNARVIGLIKNPQMFDVGELFKMTAIQVVKKENKLFEEDQVNVFSDPEILSKLIVSDKKSIDIKLLPSFENLFKSESQSEELFIRIHLQNLGKRLAESKKEKNLKDFVNIAKEYISFVSDHMQYIPQSDKILTGLKQAIDASKLLEGKQSMFMSSENSKIVQNENVSPKNEKKNRWNPFK